MEFARFPNSSLSDENSMDVTFEFQDGKRLKAHSWILADRNKYFLSMFMRNTTESRTKIVKIEDCSYEAFKVYRDYLYTGVPREITLELLQIGDKYLDGPLKQKCEDFLCRDIYSRNVFDKLETAIGYNCETLKKRTLSYIRQNLTGLSRGPEFEKFCGNKEAVKCLLLSPTFAEEERNPFQPYEKFAKLIPTLKQKDYYYSWDVNFKTESSIQRKQIRAADLFWDVTFGAFENDAGKSDFYLEIVSASTYFEYCTADILMTLGLHKPQFSICKHVRSIDLYKGKSLKLFVKSLDDSVKFFNSVVCPSKPGNIIFTFSNVKMAEPMPLKKQRLGE